MPISLIKKNQLDPNIADLVGEYGSGLFLPIRFSGQLESFISGVVSKLSGVESINALEGYVSMLGKSGINVSTSGNSLVISYTGKTFSEDIIVDRSGFFGSGIGIGNNSISITPTGIDGGYSALGGSLTNGLLGIQYSGYFDNDPDWFSTANVKPIINQIILSGSTESEFNGTFTRVSSQYDQGTSYFQGNNGSVINYNSQFPVSESYWQVDYNSLPSKFISYDLEAWFQNPEEIVTGVAPTGTITQTQNSENSIIFNASRALSNGTSWEWVGYFIANDTSSHNFYLSADERAFLWMGDKAVTGYTTGNADADSSLLTPFSLSLNSGQSYPVRLQWGHPSTPTNLGLSLSYRNGIQSTTYDFSGLFFQGSVSRGFAIDKTSGNAYFAGNIQSNTATFNYVPTVSGIPLLTGTDLSSYATLEALRTGLSGVTQVAIGYSMLSAQVYTSGLSESIASQTGSFITSAQTGAFYRASNPSGFITGVNLSAYALNANTGSFITTGQTGRFYAASNPSGFITGVNLSAYTLNANTGSFITSGQTGAFASAVNLASTGNSLTTRINNLSGRAILGNGVITGIVSVTQAEYDALTPSAAVIYLILE